MGAVANRVESFWVPDHLDQLNPPLLPRSLWTQEYCGATGLLHRIASGALFTFTGDNTTGTHEFHCPPR
jgi:hypothetical protein